MGPEVARGIDKAGNKTGGRNEYLACEILNEAERAGARSAVEAN